MKKRVTEELKKFQKPPQAQISKGGLQIYNLKSS